MAHAYDNVAGKYVNEYDPSKPETNKMTDYFPDDTILRAASSAPRAEILAAAAAATLGDRNRDYGSPHKNMNDIADLFNTYIKAKYGLEIKLSAQDVCFFEIMQKMARTFKSPLHMDSHVDMAAYAAMGYEVALEDAG